jgi:hypothetical protein
MYKKLISSLLALAFLNLVGCYSTNVITTEELNQIEELSEIEIITSDSVYYSFERFTNRERMFNAPDKYYYEKWNIGSDTLNVYAQSLAQLSKEEYYKIKKDTLSIPFNQMYEISAYQFDAANTYVAVVSIVVIIAAIIIGLSELASSGWDIE